MLRGFIREPGLITDLPRWIKDANVRRDPLRYRQPWWNYNAVAFVQRHLPPSAQVAEFGGGASTLWLRDLGATVITIEDHQEWFENLRAHLPDADLRFVAAAPGDTQAPKGPFNTYVHALDAEPDGTFDLIIVDGKARRDCVLRTASKVKPGGMLLLDDSQASDTDPPARRDVTRLRQTYVDLPALLGHWPVHHLRGIKPGTWLPVQTTVWIKP